MKSILSVFTRGCFLLLLFLATTPANANLIAYWPLDEKEGTIAADASCQAHDALLLQGLSFDNDSIIGRFDSALHLDGANDYLTAASYALSTSAFSFSLWINPDNTLTAASPRADLVYWSSGARPHLTFNRAGNGCIGLHVSIADAQYDDVFTNTSSWTAGQWYHVVTTFDGSDCRLYVNGQLETTVSHPGTHTAASRAVLGANAGGSNVWPGALDDLRFYDHALSQSEVETIFLGSSIHTFSDDFTNDNVTVNDGVGGDWTPADQDTPWQAHTESGTQVVLYNAASAWNIGAIKTIDTFAADATVRVSLTGLNLASGSDSSDRGNGLATTHSAQVSLADHTNSEPYPSGYKNDNKAAVNIEINQAGDTLGFTIHRSTLVNNSETVEWGGVFDMPASQLSLNNPLTIDISVTPQGDYAVTFDKTWSLTGGTQPGTPLEGSLGAALTDDLFILAIGCQGVQDNNAVALFDNLTVSAAQAMPPRLLSVLAHDPDNTDTVLSAGDTLTLLFNTPTNTPPVATKAQIDGLIDFQAKSLGNDYSALWTATDQLVITVNNAASGTLAIGDTITIIADGADDLTDPKALSDPSTSSATVQGNWGIQGGPLVLHTRRRVQAQDAWTIIEETLDWDPAKTALVICDMWDSHPDYYKAVNVGMMAITLNQALKDLRQRGVTIIHCPSGTMSFYSGTTQRQMMIDAPYNAYPPGIDNGWNNPESWEYNYYSAMQTGISETRNNAPGWTRQHPNIEILPGDGITESGQECYNLFMARGIRNILVTGVHTNWCVLGRAFAIRQWRYIKNINPQWNVMIVRDMTDTGVGLGDSVTIDGIGGIHQCHDRATDKIVEHIERFWAPSVDVNNLLNNPQQAPRVYVNNNFDDDDLYFDWTGLQDWRLGGGLYNISQNHNWTATAGVANESAAVQENGQLLTLAAFSDGYVAAVMTRAMFPVTQSCFDRGVEIAWQLDTISHLYNGTDPATGFCIGVIDADGSVATPNPTNLDTPQLYLNIRDLDGNTKADGSVCYSQPGNPRQQLPGTAYTFDTWNGATPLTIRLAILPTAFKLTFSETINTGQHSLQGTLPDALAGINLLNAFASLQDPAGATANCQSLQIYSLPNPDLNDDTTIDTQDVAVMGLWWHNNSTAPDWAHGADLNQDGVVNLADLADLSNFWLNNCTQ